MPGERLMYADDVLRAADPATTLDAAGWHVHLHALRRGTPLPGGWTVEHSTVRAHPFPHAVEWVATAPGGRVYSTIVAGRHAVAGADRAVLDRFCRECAPALFLHI